MYTVLNIYLTFNKSCLNVFFGNYCILSIYLLQKMRTQDGDILFRILLEHRAYQLMFFGDEGDEIHAAISNCELLAEY